MFQSRGLRWSSEQMPVCRQQGICAVLGTLPQGVIDCPTPVCYMLGPAWGLGASCFLGPPKSSTTHVQITQCMRQKPEVRNGNSYLEIHPRLQYKPTSAPQSFLSCISGNTERCTKGLRREYKLWNNTTKGNTVYPPTTLINLKSQSKLSWL